MFLNDCVERKSSEFSSESKRWMVSHPEHQYFSERSIKNLVGSEGELQNTLERLGDVSPATTKRYYRPKPTVVTTLSSQIK